MCFAPKIKTPAPPPTPAPEPPPQVSKPAKTAKPKGQDKQRRRAAVAGTSTLRIPLPRINAPR